ncbi:hypothetical protein NC651_040475 [Populus alba x Populus x berolinensis]|nr:hypothetical protein NC651_040475 [Populus alba x Populus x berolinensis]
MKSVNLNGKNVKSLCFGYLKQYGWNSKDLKICSPNVHSLSLWGELDFEDYMIEDRSCTCLERVELGFQLKLENLVDDEAFKKLLRSTVVFGKVLQLLYRGLKFLEAQPVLEITGFSNTKIRSKSCYLG